MKKLSIIICALFVAPIAYSQPTIIYDHKSGDPPKNEVAKKDDYVVYKVININTFIYDVKIDGKQTNLHNNGGDAFSRILTEETIESVISSDIVDESDNLAKRTGVEGTINGFSAYNLEVSQAEEFLESYEVILVELNLLPSSITIRPEMVEKIKELKALIAQQKVKIQNLKIKITSLESALIDGYDKALADLNASAYLMQGAYENLKKSKRIKNRLVAFAKQVGINSESAQDLLDDLSRQYPFFHYPHGLMDEFNASYLKYQSAYNSFIANPDVLIFIDPINKDVKKTKAVAASLNEEVQNVWRGIDKAYYEKLFDDICTLKNELINPQNYFVTSAPVQAKMDIVTFDIKIEPKQEVETNNRQTEHFPATVDVKGGTKIDFSSGFGWSQLQNQSYSISESNQDSTMSVIRKDSDHNVGQVSLVTFMHISPRVLWAIKPSLTFGLGLGSTDITAANFYLGGSAIIGRADRFIMTFGGSLRQIDFLQGKYSLDKEFLTTSLSDVELTQKTMRLGFFVGVSYNLTSKPKEVPKN